MKKYGSQIRQTALAVSLAALAAGTTARADYSNTVASFNPVGYWRLNEPAGSGTATNIGSALATGNATYIASPTMQQPGAMGTDPAALFDGTSQYASVPYNAAFNPPGSFTVGFWANKTNSDNGTRGAIFSRDLAAPDAANANGWLFFASNGDGNWWFRTYTANTRANVIAGPIVFNQWTYVVGVHDATDTGTNYLYVNGVLAAPPVGNAGYTPNASFPMFFAAWADTSAAAVPGFFFPGRLDEIAFFDKVLTPAQIHDLYVAAEYPPRIVQQPSAPGKFYLGDPVPITLSVVVDNVSATPATFQWTKNTTNIPSATTASLALGVATTNTSGNYAVVVSNPNGSVTSTVVSISVVMPPPGRVDYAHTVLSLDPVAYYRLNDAANATTTTNVGNWGTGADGTYKPGATSGASGVPYPGFGAGNYATRFAGTAGLKDGDVGNPNTPGSCIQVPAQSGIVEEMTITCWVKRSGDNVVWRGLVTQRDNDSSAPSGAGNGTGLTLGADNATPDRGAELRMLWNKGDVWWQWSPQLNTPNQQWAFCAVVFSATNRTIYLNTRQASQTVEAAGANMPQTPHDWAVNPIFIGYDARGPYYTENSAFNGTMDEVAIFNRALTTNEMMQIFAAAEVPPLILVQPQAPPPPVYEGMMLSLSVVADVASSTTPLAYQWTKNGTAISGQTATSYMVSNLVTNDSGSYAVVITNTHGAVTSSIVALTVLSGPPFIAQQPQSIQRYAGGMATFSVTAFGSSPLSYQWYFSTPAVTNMIAGATNSSYTVSQVGTADAGNYSVRVTNPYGNTNSGNAALTLLTANKLAATITDLAPLAYWRLDETSGTVAYDYWGGRDGTRTSGATNNADGPSPTSTPTPCLGFDATNKAYGLNGGWVSVPPLKLSTHTVTMIAWVNPVDVSGGHHGIVFSKTGQDALDGCGLDWWSGGLLEYQWNSARRDNPASGLYVIPGQWNFVALVVEPSRGSIYLDDGNGGGLQSFSNPANNGIAQFGGELRLGSDVQDNRNFIGLIDDAVIFDRALSPDEIESIRQAGVNGIYAPARAFRWKGMGGADWSVAGNWNNLVPGASDTAVLSDSASAGATVNLDTDVTVSGLTFNNKVANQTIASPGGKTLTLASGSMVTVNAGSHSISANVNAETIALSDSVIKSGSGTLTLSGTANSIAGSLKTDGGTLTIASSAALTVSGEQLTVLNGSTMVVSGTVNSTVWSTVGMDAAGSPESTMILKDSGQFNNTAGFLTVGDGGLNDGRLIIQDTAQVNASMMILGQYGSGTRGYVIQNSGAVNLTLSTPASLWYVIPALQIGSSASINWGGTAGNGQGEYHLNGGTLTAHSIGGGGGANGGSSKFYFNGGILKPTVSDAAVAVALAGMAAPAQTLFMQYLTQVVVEENGAIINTADLLSISIAQSLLPGTGTGGLTKQGLGTLTLLQPSTYTGTTKVQGGTLACATTASLAPTALEISATAKVDLQYSGTRIIPGLTLGVAVKGPGVYGMGTDPTYFTGAGTVTVQQPTPPTPTLPLGSFSLATGGVPTFSNVPTTAGYTYWLTYKNSLTDATWTRIGTGTAGGGNKTFTDTVTPYPASRFYRLEVQ